MLTIVYPVTRNKLYSLIWIQLVFSAYSMGTSHFVYILDGQKYVFGKWNFKSLLQIER